MARGKEVELSTKPWSTIRPWLFSGDRVFGSVADVERNKSDVDIPRRRTWGLGWRFWERHGAGWQVKPQAKSLLEIEANTISGCRLGLDGVDGRSRRGSGRIEYRNHLEKDSKEGRTEMLRLILTGKFDDA